MAVVGGGPAGTALALALTDVGRSVVVFERSRYVTTRVGETLPPEIRVPLTALGVWDRFVQDGPLPCPGVVSVWGSPSPRDNDAILNPFGSGWHVDRRRFDAMLAHAASARGAEVLWPCRLRSWERLPSGEWSLGFLADEHALQVRARVLVDATGRAASPLRRLGGGRLVYDRLIGLVGFVEGDVGGDLRVLVEAVGDGWWYSSPLPQGQVVAAFMTDADLLPSGAAARHELWRDRARAAKYTRMRLGDRPLMSALRFEAANSSILRDIAGGARAAIGDAAATFDPLSGQGVYHALCSSLAAARALDRFLGGDTEALSEIVRHIHADVTDARSARSMYYGLERRWPGSMFWARRRGEGTGIASE